MSHVIHAARRFVAYPSMVRSVAIATLLGTTLLASPLVSARADGTTAAPLHLAQAASQQADSTAAEGKAETLELRITNLHTALQITSDEESKWDDVAKAMRDNAAAIDALIAEKTAQSPQDLTAMQDLQAYETFAQAHVDGLKNLISAFGTLYASMPAPQQKVADQVFQTFGHNGHSHT